MINAFDQAAYMMNSSWDVLAHNRAARILFEDFTSPRPNMLRIVFFSDHYRQKIQDRQFAARLVLLKARHDSLTGGKSPILRAILNEVLQAVPQAMEWWDDLRPDHRKGPSGASTALQVGAASAAMG
jgi:hypothetical protein